MRIDIYSDTVCPWCYLGKRRFELALAARPQYEPRVTWRPFELNPDIPDEGVDRAAYLAGSIGTPERVAEAHADLAPRGPARGIESRFDLIGRMPNTRRAHLLMAHAARCGRQTDVMNRVMLAYFEEACDIGDIEVLVRPSAPPGLPDYDPRSPLLSPASPDLRTPSHP